MAADREAAGSGSPGFGASGRTVALRGALGEGRSGVYRSLRWGTLLDPRPSCGGQRARLPQFSGCPRSSAATELLLITFVRDSLNLLTWST